MLFATKLLIGAISAALIAPLVDADPRPRALPKPSAEVKEKAPSRISKKYRGVERSARVARSEPVTKEDDDGSNEEPVQFVLRLTAFSAASDTLQSLGLLDDGRIVREPELLRSHDVWDTALDTASRLGAVAVLSRAPGLRTYNKRKQDLSITSTDREATDPVSGKTVAMNFASTWIVTPTLLDDKRLLLDAKYRWGFSEISPELSVNDIADGAGRGVGVETCVEIPFDKPTIVGRFTFLSREEPTASDKVVETNMLLVVTAHRLTEKEKREWNSTLDLKTKPHSQSSSRPQDPAR